jgi:hypothetical protein
VAGVLVGGGGVIVGGVIVAGVLAGGGGVIVGGVWRRAGAGLVGRRGGLPIVNLRCFLRTVLSAKQL